MSTMPDIATLRSQRVREAMSQDDFWLSENAIVRAKVLQNPAIMAATLELLQQSVTILQRDIEEMRKWLKLQSVPPLTMLSPGPTKEPSLLPDPPMLE